MENRLEPELRQPVPRTQIPAGIIVVSARQIRYDWLELCPVSKIHRGEPRASAAQRGFGQRLKD
jgi:hypothetical protein